MARIFNRHIATFFRHYKLFSSALLVTLAALVLQLGGMPDAAHWVLAGAALLIALPLLKGMWEDFQAGAYGIDILALTAIVTAVLLKEYWAAIVVVLMLTGGEALEDYAERRSRKELDALLSRAPQLAHVLRGKKITDIPANQVKVGDKIIIKPGETVPVDAKVTEGNSSFDESSLTGEGIPVEKSPGAMLLSGSINSEGAVTALAVATAANSQYQRIIKLVKSAANSQAPFVRLADRYSVPFTIFAFALAGAVWAVSGDAKRFLEVIIVATPCPLILAAPIAIISGMSRAAKQGIIVRTGSALERLAQVRTVAFDKTGTLTRGKPVVDQVITYGKLSKQEVLGYASALETSSAHVLALAINEAALQQNVKIPKVRHISESSGQGLTASVGGKQVLVGRITHLQKHGVQLPKQYKPAAIKQTVTYVAVDGQLAGALTFKDDIRPESQRTLTRLKRLGIRDFTMVTGDNSAAANQVARTLGISQVTAEALPAAKLHAIEAVKDRPVAFVGDGVNDAPVLTAADVGIALGARGSTAASESADVIIMVDDISRVANALEISRRTFRIAKQSIFVGIGLSVLLMLVFATGRFEPIHGAAIQELVDVIVIFNALRAHSAGSNTDA